MQRHKFRPTAVKNFNGSKHPSAKFNSASCMLRYVLELNDVALTAQIYESNKAD